MNKGIRKITLIGIFIGLLICMILSISYAYFVVTPNKELTISGSGSIPKCVNLSMSNDKNLSLSGDYAVPIEDARILNSSSTTLDNYKYSFTINNGCASKSEVTIAFIPLDANSMPLGAVKYILVPSGASILSETPKFLNADEYKIAGDIKSDIADYISYGDILENKVYQLDKLTVSGSSSFDLYVWIDYNEGGLGNNSTKVKTFIGYIFISNYDSIGVR